MLPKGAIHIPRTSFGVGSFTSWAPDSITVKRAFTDKGTAKIAKDLGMDYAEAVVRA